MPPLANFVRRVPITVASLGEAAVAQGTLKGLFLEVGAYMVHGIAKLGEYMPTWYACQNLALPLRLPTPLERSVKVFLQSAKFFVLFGAHLNSLHRLVLRTADFIFGLSTFGKLFDACLAHWSLRVIK